MTKKTPKPKLTLRERLTPSARTKRAWRNRFIFVAVVAAGIAAWVFYINSFTIYDYSHLIVIQDFGESRPFAPIAGSLVYGKVRAAETESLALYICEASTNIAVADLRNGSIWYASPPGAGADERAVPHEVNVMNSAVGFTFFTEGRQRSPRGLWLFPDAAYEGQFEKFSIPNGIRIEYVIGSLDLGIDALPFFMTQEAFDERIMAHAETGRDQRFLRQFWFESEDMPGFMQLTAGIRESRIQSQNMVDFFYEAGWTYDDTVEQNRISNTEPELTFETFYMTVEFILDGDALIANLPLSRFTTTTLSLPETLHFMRFFGAGGPEDTGFLLVPSGAGAKIMFNNGKYREEAFVSDVYGLDPMMNIIRPQVMQPTRLPVIGVRKNDAAFVAHITSGAGLASVNAEVAGMRNNYNNAWFSFNLRTFTEVAVTGIAGGGGDMTILQEEIYQGDITIRYEFIAAENPCVADMAAAYRNFLVEAGALTRLVGISDRSFYMDVIGAIDVRRHFIGTPYTTTEVMTTLADAENFIDTLNSHGISTIQMQLHGWFNRGINHDVAKNIRPIRGVGSQAEMQSLDARLREDGGGLHPAVNFQFTNSRSRRFNRRFESARYLAGYLGFMTHDASRDSLTMLFTHHFNDWTLLVHPAVLPFHIDSFLPSFESRVGLPGIALTDLGDVLSGSLFRRDAVDRESARLIAREQLGRLDEQISSIVVFGGNDYALRFASHLVDVPTQADMFYILDYEVPFFSMVVHGYIEFAGRAANMREDYCFTRVLLNSMATGASPRYTFSREHTRVAQFSPHERMYSTQFDVWLEAAVTHYTIFNEVYRYLRAETITGFEILAPDVTVTEFSDGTRIYVNHGANEFSAGGVTVPSEWFFVTGDATR